MSYRVLVCGGRDYFDCNAVYSALDELRDRHGGIAIIHGGADGADYLAAAWGHDFATEVLRVPADWSLHGRAAGPIRNQKMLDTGKPDLVLAFPGGRGTADMVRKARAAGVTVIEVAKGTVREPISKQATTTS